MARSDDKTTVVVTGCGLVSALGLDVANACAAARAGIVRASSMDVYPVRSSADGAVAGVACHAVPFLTEGFEGEARLIRLIQGGLEVFARQCPDSPWKTSRTAFYLSLPSTHRLLSGVELVADEEARKEMLEAAKEAGDRPADLKRAGRLLSQGAQRAGWQGQPNLKWCTESGNTGVAEAIRQASEDLGKGVCDLAIVGGVDSLLDEDTLSWLEMTGRLKTPDLASGLQPGEACGFLLLETESAASIRGTRMLPRVDAIRFADESKPLFSGEPSTGVALAQVLKAAAQSIPGWESSPIWLIHDLNGESYRANEWGMALFRLASGPQIFTEPILWLSALSFGDIGAATGAVHACIAVRGWARTYLPTAAVGLVSAAEGAGRACMAFTHR